MSQSPIQNRNTGGNARQFRFRCVAGCTACCRQKGFVYLTEDDLKRAARFIRMTAAEFERKFVYRTRNRLRLRVPRHSQCHFLSDAGCSLHPVKPAQCRIFPFWPELVDSRRGWRKTARYCPGISRGPLVSIQSAQKKSEEMRASYPHMYSR